MDLLTLNHSGISGKILLSHSIYPSRVDRLVLNSILLEIFVIIILVTELSFHKRILLYLRAFVARVILALMMSW